MNTELKKVVVIGGGGYAKVVISIIKELDCYEIYGYTDNADNGSILGVRYLGDDRILKEVYSRDNVEKAVLGVGQLQDSTLRRSIVCRLKKIGFFFPAIVSKTAILSDGVKLGEGTIVRDNATISASSTVGSYSIIGTSANINHDSTIGSYSNIAIGSNIGAEVNIGDDVLVGMGTVVMNKINVIDKCLIGAGSLVLKNCEVPGVYYGSPAKKIKGI